VITDAMVEEAAIRAWRSEGRASACWADVSPASQTMFRNEARAVLEYALSNFPSATLGPTREERLVSYRCAVAVAWGGSGASPERIEARAHAMLAAERPADAPARDEVEQLRRVAREMIRTIELNGLESKFMITLSDLRALLPTDGETP
jgi:hypothetical protein